MCFKASLTPSFFIEKYNQLENEIKKLLMEGGELKGRIQEIIKLVPEEGNATCAIASGSDLEK